MRTIWKYKLNVGTTTEIHTKAGARLLDAQTQGEDICLWFLLDDRVQPKETRTFAVYGTGHMIDKDVYLLQHVSTVQFPQEGLVFHVFEVTRA